MRKSFARRYRKDPVRAIVGGTAGAIVGTGGGILLASANPNIVGVFGAIGGVMGGAIAGVLMVSDQNDCRGANGGTFGGFVGVFFGAMVGAIVDVVI